MAGALHSTIEGLEDLFGGGGGSHDQGTPTTSGPGDGGKGTSISRWLSTITGAYEAITGSGTKNGPAPAPQATPAKATPWILYGAVVLAILAVLWLFKKR